MTDPQLPTVPTALPKRAEKEEVSMTTAAVATAAEEDSTNATSAMAMSTADALNLSLLQSDQERKLHTLQSNHDTLTETCNQQRSQITELTRKVAEMQAVMLEKEELLGTEKKSRDSERKRAESAVEMEKDANERLARMQLEADSLRQEISRLSTSNTSLNTQLSELTAKTNLSTTSAAPLQFEVTRLKSELEALNSHTKWLEEELSSRSTQSSALKSTHAKQILDLNTKLNEMESTKSDVESELSLLKLKMNSMQARVESIQKTTLEKEKNHADIVHELNVEVQAERHLVSLKNEHIARLEDRYNDSVREIESMKALAAAAHREQREQMDTIRASIEQDIRLALEENDKKHERELEDMQRQMQNVILEKTKLEDMLMGSGSILAIGDGSADQQLSFFQQDQQNRTNIHVDDNNNINTNSGGEPISLMKLYDKLAEKDEELRREKAERHKVELYIERLSQDFEKAAPQQRQQRREYEQAMTQMSDMQSRMQDLLQDNQIARDELNLKQREFQQVDSECHELRLENKDLARQVQQLLRKSMGGDGDLAMDIQTQNQQLLREHHRSSARVRELEEQLDSDMTQQQLRDALASLKELEEERENQATLVQSIVQQRDLYRALLAKNDSQILAATSGGGDQSSVTAIVAAKDQIEKYTEVESKNRELSNTITKLNADLLTANNTKQGLEERLKRLDSHATELSQSNNKLQNDLLAANAAIARSNAEASFQMQKVTRLEESLENCKNESNRLNENKKELQKLNSELQAFVSESEIAQMKRDEVLRQTEVQLKLAETKVQMLQAAEGRLSIENSSLRSELSRHVALQESMLKLESGISARNQVEHNHLKETVEKMTRELEAMKEQHMLEVEKLQNQLQLANLKLEEVTKDQQASLQNAIQAKSDVLTAKTALKEFETKCKDLETELNAAKAKLGDLNIGLSENDRIQEMTLEIERLKNELEAATQKVSDYKKITKASETTLGESTKASIEYKNHVTSEISTLKEELAAARKELQLRQEALEELTADLSQTRGEQEKAVERMKAETDSVKTELGILENDRDVWKTRAEKLTQEIQVHQANVKISKDNYERELALHAEARRELQAAREHAIKEAQLNANAELKIDNMKSELCSKQQIFDDTKRQLEESMRVLERQALDATKQNKILHDQLATLGDKINSIQNEKESKVLQMENEQGDGASDVASPLRKQVTELREVVNYMRNEREILDTQLQSARLSAERERASGEILKKSLSEARNELELLQNSVSTNSSDDVNKSLSETSSKLKQSEDQVLLLRESNKFLREDCEKLEKQLKSLQEQYDEVKNAMKPSEEKHRQMEIEKAVLVADKESLMREVDVWKKRVTSLVSKFHQIDPEEHKKALAEIESMKSDLEKLKSEKESIETQAKGAKTMIAKLNKEVMKMKTALEASRASLEKAQKEIETLKISNISAASEKQIKELEESKKSVTQELVATKQRVENLSQMLKGHKKRHIELQSKFHEVASKEQEAQAALTKEKESHQATLKCYEMLKIEEEKLKSKVATQDVSNIPVESSSETSPQETSAANDTKSMKPVQPKAKKPNEGFNYGPSDPKPSSAGDVEMKVTEEKKEKPNVPSTSESKQLEDMQIDVPNEAGKNEVDSNSTTKNTTSESHQQNINSLVKSKKVSSKADTGTVEKDKSVESKEDSNITKADSSTDIKSGDADESTSKATKTEENSLREKLLKRKRESLIDKEENTNTEANAVNEVKAEDTDGISSTDTRTGENSLREKLMKRKRELAKTLEAQNASKKAAIASLLDNPTPAPVSKESTVESVVDIQDHDQVLEENKSAAVVTTFPKAVESDTKSADEVHMLQTVEEGKQLESPPESEKTLSNQSNEPSKNADDKKNESVGNEEKVTTEKPEKVNNDGTTSAQTGFQTIFGSDATPTFASGKTLSFGSKMNANAKPFTPTIGSSSFGETTDSKSEGGAFLNLKPPGSGQNGPLIFGTTGKIQLPTPAKNSPVAPFGTPFGSASVFGGISSNSTKKRLLEEDSDANKEEFSTKVNRLDDAETSKDIVSDETKNEKVPEKEAENADVQE